MCQSLSATQSRRANGNLWGISEPGTWAHALLYTKIAKACDQSVRASPIFVFNEGRQVLTGNVGYRVIEANVRELLHTLANQSSWC